MVKKLVTALLLILLLIDIVYSFNQHLKAPLDGDIAHNVIPSADYKKVLEDPFAMDVLLYKKSCGAPNRFFAHWFQSKYFKNIPFLFKYFTDPLNSVYISCALVKTIIQISIIFLLSLYIVQPVFSKQNILIAAVLIAPLFQTEGYNAYMGIIDRSVTYTIFYALPFVLLLLFFFPFYKVFVTRTQTKFKVITSILLFLLMFVLAFNGPLVPGVVLLVCPMVLGHYFFTNYKKNPQCSFIKRIAVSIKDIPKSFLFYFILLSVICLYSLYIGTYNIDGLKYSISVWERYKKIPEGLFTLVTQKLGLPLLLCMIGINALIIKTKYYTAESSRILFYLKCILVFSFFYTLLLPLGGYRVYRPDIIRYDTFMPITIALIFIYGLSSFYLINNISPAVKKYYITGIILYLSIFTYADGPLKRTNACERQAIETINNAKEDTVVLTCNCPVMDWERFYHYKYSTNNSQLLQYWGVFTKNKLYYHQRTDSLFINKIELFENSIRGTKKWLDGIKIEAMNKNISIDSCIYLNARYMAELDMQKMKKDPMYAKIEGLKWAIRKNKKWLSDVTKRAKERRISVDSNIAIEARWMASTSYKKTKQDSLFEKIEGVKAAIRKDKKWLNDVTQKAKERNISFDSCMIMEAKYAVGIKNDAYRKQLEKNFKMVIRKDKEELAGYQTMAEKKNIPLDSCINTAIKRMPENSMQKIVQGYLTKRKTYYTLAINKDKKWLSDITRKAKEKNISLDSSISLNAGWMAEQELKK